MLKGQESKLNDKAEKCASENEGLVFWVVKKGRRIYIAKEEIEQ